MTPAQTPSERPPSGGEDPVASLFSADRTLPAPVVAPEVNESELTRWKSARDSLFGESVKDPAPSPKGATAQPSRAGRTLAVDEDEPLTEGRRSPQADKPVAGKPRQDERTSDSGTPLVRALSVSRIGQQHEAARTAPRVLEDASDLAPPSSLPKLDAPNKKKTALHAGAPPPALGPRGEPPLAPPPAAAKRGLEPPTAGKKARPDGTGATRTKKKTPPPRPASAEVAETAAVKKKFRRGPKPLLLSALALLVLAAGGVSAVVLEIVPDPFAEPDAPIARATGRAPAQRAAAPKPPAAPAAAPVAAAPATVAAPAAASSKAPAAKPIAKAATSQPVAAKPVVAAAAPAAAAPALEEPPAGADNDQLIALARKALAEENATQAEALARRALAKDEGDHHAMEVLARALIDQDQGPEAVHLARRIVEKRKKRVPYRLLLGDALLMVGDAAGARKEWQAAAELEPNNREVKQRLQ